MRNFIKIKRERFLLYFFDKQLKSVWEKFLVPTKKQTVTLLVCIFIISTCYILHKEVSEISLGTEEAIQFKIVSPAVTSNKTAVISIPSGMVKANPVLPYRDIGDSVPTIDIPDFNLVEPPVSINENSNAARVMDMIVSGILYDKYSPSAILNIEGNDYLVKKGDIVNNYKVLNITKDSVTVKLGSNTYKAGIGEILTEGTLNHNDVSNLKNKFGGMQ